MALCLDNPGWLETQDVSVIGFYFCLVEFTRIKVIPSGGSSADDLGTPALTDWYFEPGNNGIDNTSKNYIGLWNVVFVFFKTLSFKVSIDLVLKIKKSISFCKHMAPDN